MAKLEPYEIEEKQFKRFLKKNNYHHPKIKCCATCEKSSKDYEGRECFGDEKRYDHSVNYIDDLAICDLWEERK